MSWDFLERAKFSRTLWGRAKLAVWDFWYSWMDFFGIDAGPLPKSWSKGT